VQLLEASIARIRRRNIVWVCSLVGLLFFISLTGWYVQRRYRAAHILAAANLATDALQKVLIAQELQGLPEPTAGLATLRKIASERVPWMVLRGQGSPLTDGLFLGSKSQPVISSEDGTIMFWDSYGGELSAYKLGDRGFGGYTTSIDATPDGRRIAFASSYGNVGILEDGALVATPANLQSKSALHAVAYSGDGASLAAGGKSRQIHFAGAHEKLSLATIGAVNSLAWTRDSRYLISGSDSSIDVFDAESGRKSISVDSGADSIAVSPDGKQFAATQISPLGKGVVTLWNTSTGKQEASYSMTEGATSVDYSRSGMLAAADGKVVHIWSKNTYSSILTGHTAAVQRVRFSADGKLLLAVLSDGKAFIWQMQDQDAVQLGNLSWSGLISNLMHKTAACLMPSEREDLMSESFSTAESNYKACEKSHGRPERPLE
jgi:WD40 repeat protein